MAGLVDVRVQHRVDDPAIGFFGERPHLVPSGPRRRHRAIGRGLRLVRIDAAREQRFETRADAWESKRLRTSVLKPNPGRCPSSNTMG